MNPYLTFVSESARLLREGRSYPLGGFDPPPRPDVAPDAPKALFFAPHPDDECISGGMAVRLLRQARMNVINVPVTLGSKKSRQAERYRELQAACHYLGFGLIPTGPNGLERVNSQTRRQDKTHWAACVDVIARILAEQQPRVILFPHLHDWNSTHIGTHLVVMDALKQMPPSFSCHLVETEFWGQMTDPNLMLEISAEDLTDMITATTFHVAEVKRNPYHLLLPVWMMDNVRRGAEIVGGQGGAAPDFTFAALYRVRQWRRGKVAKLFEGGKQVPASVNVGELFS
jgi:LmbE family N-acetylglucosaminyl deacetylase